MIFCPSVGVPESALIVNAPAWAVAAYKSKLSEFQASGDDILAVELTRWVIVLLVSVWVSVVPTIAPLGAVREVVQADPVLTAMPAEG